jgi:hypothetical protein
MTPSDSLSSIHHFFCTYRFLIYFHKKVTRRVSTVPLITLLTCRSPSPRVSSVLLFQVLHTFHCLRPNYQGLDFSLATNGGFFDETAGFTLCYHLLVCLALCTKVTLSQVFNLRISSPVAC